MLINKNKSNFIVLLLLLLTIVQFMNYQVYFSFVLIFWFLFPQVIRGKLQQVPAGQWLILIITFCVYFLIYQQNHEVQIFRYMTFLIGPPMFYYCGMIYVKSNREKYANIFMDIMLVLSVGGSLYAFACIINRFLHYGTYLTLLANTNIVTSMQSRYGLDIWTNTLLQPTNLNSYCIFAVISLYPAYRFVEHKWKRICFYSASIIAIVVCLLSGSRTNLLFTAFGLLLGTLLSGDFGQKKGLFAITKTKLIGGVVVVLGLLVFSDSIAELIASSSLGSRLQTQQLSISTDGRWERMSLVWNHLLDYPLGNMPYSEAHNLWLDTARVSGIVAMCLMIVYTIGVLFSAFRLSRKQVDEKFRIWCVLYAVIMFSSFMIEPVLEGRPYIFMMFCFLAGMLKMVEKRASGAFNRR